jgi:hypothetical protein
MAADFEKIVSQVVSDPDDTIGALNTQLGARRQSPSPMIARTSLPPLVAIPRRRVAGP